MRQLQSSHDATAPLLRLTRWTLRTPAPLAAATFGRRIAAKHRVALNLALDIFADALATGPRPERGISVVHEETLVPTSIEETFAFFSDAANLEKLTPGWLNFQIRSEGPLVMREGLEIDYVIVLHGFPIPWKTRIDVWEPGVRFVDRQTNGPYVWWHHEHRFEAAADGTRVIDHVEFVPRLRWVTTGMVTRDVRRIFEFRGEALRRLFGGQR